jgi:hypothetical protein
VNGFARFAVANPIQETVKPGHVYFRAFHVSQVIIAQAKEIGMVAVANDPRIATKPLISKRGPNGSNADINVRTWQLLRIERGDI